MYVHMHIYVEIPFKNTMFYLEPYSLNISWLRQLLMIHE